MKMEELKHQEQILNGTLDAGEPQDVYARLNAKHRASKQRQPQAPQEDSDDGVANVWKNVTGKSKPKAKSSESSSSFSVPVSVTEYGGLAQGDAVYERVAGPAVHPDKLMELRRAMYDQHCSNEVFTPGPRSKYDSKQLSEQTKCSHPFKSIQWGSNASCTWGSCKDCGLRTCIMFRKRQVHMVASPGEFDADVSGGVFSDLVWSDAEEPEHQLGHGNQEDFPGIRDVSPDIVKVNTVQVDAGRALIDTGCRLSLAGASWHSDFQKCLRKMGKAFESENRVEHFQFGPGEVIQSTRSWRYPVGSMGQEMELVMAEIPVNCPGLIGPDELAAWDAVLDFSRASISCATTGKDISMESTVSGHSCLSLLDFEPVCSRKVHGTFLVFSSGSSDDSLMKLLDETKKSDFKFPMPDDMLSSEESSHYWTSDAEDTAMSDAGDHQEDVENDLEEEFLGNENVDDDEDSALWMNKGLRRRIRTNMTELVSIFQNTNCKTTIKDPDPVEEDRLFLQATVSRCRKPGAWRIVEFFTWSLMFTALAGAQNSNWDVFDPVQENHFNVREASGRDQVREYLMKIDPDVLVLSPKLSPFRMKNFGKLHNPTSVRIDQQEKHQLRQLLVFISEIMCWQEARGRVVLLFGSVYPRFWDSGAIHQLRVCGMFGETVLDACACGFANPDDGQLVKEQIRVLGTFGVCEHLVAECGNRHEHAVLRRRLRVECQGRHLRMPLVDYLSGLSKELVNIVLKQSLNYLSSQGYHDPEGDVLIATLVAFPTSAAEMPTSVPEATGVFPDEEEQRGWSAQEVPEPHREEGGRIPAEVRREVRKQHYGLGHPSKDTFLRMLRLGGASDAAIRYASIWRCPVCTASAAPGVPLSSSPRLRPSGFNKIVGIDLKYLKDAVGNRHIRLR